WIKPLTTNQEGAGSSPAVCSNHQRVGEPGRPCLPWKQEIGGSNPSTLTTIINKQERSMSDIKIYGEHEPKTLAQMRATPTSRRAPRPFSTISAAQSASVSGSATP